MHVNVTILQKFINNNVEVAVTSPCTGIFLNDVLPIKYIFVRKNKLILYYSSIKNDFIKVQKNEKIKRNIDVYMKWADILKAHQYMPLNNVVRKSKRRR